MVTVAGRLCVAMALSFVLGCSSREPSEPLLTDVDAARTAWLANKPTSYEFNVTVAASLLIGPLHVTVVGGRVASAFDARGKSVPSFTTTIDSIWSSILDFRARGQLNSAQFDARGVPIEVDLGRPEVDAGVHYWVRGFSD
jgi:hypothetical protein